MLVKCVQKLAVIDQNSATKFMTIAPKGSPQNTNLSKMSAQISLCPKTLPRTVLEGERLLYYGAGVRLGVLRQVLSSGTPVCPGGGRPWLGDFVHDRNRHMLSPPAPEIL